MSQIAIVDNNKKMKNNNKILPLMSNKSQLYTQSKINQNQNKKNKNKSIINKKNFKPENVLYLNEGPSNILNS